MTPRITRVASDGRRITWHCSTCDQPLQPGHGWIELVGDQMRVAYARIRGVDDIKACQQVNGAISAAAYFDLPGPARWRATCRVCNGDDAGSGYFIEVAQISSLPAFIDWTGHLSDKVWHDQTDWADLCRLVAAAATSRTAA